MPSKNQVSGKVLLIEDNAESLTILLELLEDEGFQVIGARNGLIGLHLTIEHSPDVIVSDINMPQMNGYGVLYALRRNPKTAIIPIILITGETTDSERKLSLELGANDFLTKPVVPKDFIQAIALQLKQNPCKLNPSSC
ncbi:MAG TPA: response regulator [Phormidium sp.]